MHELGHATEHRARTQSRVRRGAVLVRSGVCGESCEESGRGVREEVVDVDARPVQRPRVQVPRLLEILEGAVDEERESGERRAAGDEELRPAVCDERRRGGEGVGGTGVRQSGDKAIR